MPRVREDRRHLVISLVVMLALLVGATVLIRALKDEPSESKWSAPVWPEWGGEWVEDACNVGVCVADNVVLPIARPIETAVDVEFPIELGALSVERAWTGARSGLFGNGWSSIWDTHLVDGTLVGPLPSSPLGEPKLGGSVDLRDGTSLHIDEQGRLDEVCASGSLCTKAKWNSSSLVLSAPESAEVTLELGDGRVSKAKTFDGREVKFTYSAGRLTEVSSAAGRTTYKYESGRLASINDGNERRYTYDTSGKVTSAIDLNGETWLISPPAKQRDSFSVTSPDGWVREYQFTRGFLTEVTDATDGLMLRRTVTGGHLVKEERPLDKVTTTWDSESEFSVESISSLGIPTKASYSLDDLGRMKRIDSFEGVTAISYEDDGHAPSKVVGPNGTETYTYNDQGLLVSVSDSDGYTVEIERNKLGLPILISDGVLSQGYKYDAAGRVITETSGSRSSSAEYGDNGLLTSIRTPEGVSLYSEYDEFGRFTSFKGMSDEAFKPATQVVATTKPDPIEPNVKTANDGTYRAVLPTGESAVLDKYGRPIVVTAGKRTERRSYDGDGRLSRLEIPGQPAYVISYTDSGRVKGLVQGKISATFKWHGDLLSEVRTNTGSLYRYNYDESGRLVSSSLGALKWDYRYNDDGRSSVVNGPSGVSETRWDEHGRPLEVRDGNSVERFEWAEQGLDLIRTTRNGDDVLRFTRDADGRVSRIARVGEDSATLGYDSKTGAVNRVQIGDRDPLAVTYDDLGQVSSIESKDHVERWKWDQGQVASVKVVGERDQYSLSWSAPGIMSRVQQGSEVLLESEVDKAGRLTQLIGDGKKIAKFGWDETGLRSSEIEGGNEAQFKRDLERRLVTAKVGKREVEWKYEHGTLWRIVDGKSWTGFAYKGGKLARSVHKSGDSKSSIDWSSPGKIGAVTIKGDELDKDAINAEIVGSSPYLPVGESVLEPVSPWLDALPTEVGISMPSVTTGRDVVEAAVAEQTPRVPSFLVADRENLGLYTAQAVVAAAVNQDAAVGPDRVSDLGIGTKGKQMLLNFEGAADTHLFDFVGKFHKEDLGIVRGAFDAAQNVFGVVASTLTGGLRIIQRFLTTNRVGQWIATAGFLVAAVLSGSSCVAAAPLCVLAAAAGTTFVGSILTTSPEAGFGSTVMAALYDATLRPVGDLFSAVKDGNLFAMAMAAVAVVSLVAPVVGPRLRRAQENVLARVCNIKRVVCVSRSRFGEAGEHVAEAIKNGSPRLLRKDTAGAARRRSQNLKGIPTIEGKDRDEVPPAMAMHQGWTSVKHVDFSSNRSLGIYWRHQLSGLPDGARFFVLSVA